MKSKLMEMLESRKQEMIDIRRHLHKYPELSFKEEQTARYIDMPAKKWTSGRRWATGTGSW